MTDDVFSGDTQATPTTETDDSTSYIAKLVGDDKKFKDAEALARGKFESDTYIETLERKLDDINKELDQRMTAKEIADQIRSEMRPEQSSEQAHQRDRENEQGNQNQANQNFSTDDIERLLEKKLEERSKTTRSQANIAEANKVLRDKIGATANQYLQGKADEMGVSLEYLKEQAAVSPKAFFNLIGLNQSQPTATGFNPPSSSVSTPDSGTSERTKAYYDKLYRENPKLRVDKKTTIQEHRDMQRLGERFFS